MAQQYIEKTFQVSFDEVPVIGQEQDDYWDQTNISNGSDNNQNDWPGNPPDESYPPPSPGEPKEPGEPGDYYPPVEEDAVGYIEIELDEEKNNGKTEFKPGTDVYVKVWRNPLAGYKIKPATGHILKDGTKIPHDYSETVNFANTSQGEITRTPKVNTMNDKWLGSSPGVSPSFNGRIVTVPKKIVAVLQCDYKGLYDRWKLTNVDEAMTVPIVAVMDAFESSLEVTFTDEADDGEEEGEEVETSLTVVFCDTGDPVPGVSIWVENQYFGATNEQGIINIGMQTVGDTVVVKWKKGDKTGEVEKVI